MSSRRLVAAVVALLCSACSDGAAPSSSSEALPAAPPTAPTNPGGAPAAAATVEEDPPAAASDSAAEPARAVVPEDCFPAVPGSRLVEMQSELGAMGEEFSDEFIAPNTPVVASSNGRRLSHPLSGILPASMVQRACEPRFQPAAYPEPAGATTPAPALAEWAAAQSREPASPSHTAARRLPAPAQTELAGIVRALEAGARARWVYVHGGDTRYLTVGAGYGREAAEEPAEATLQMLVFGLAPRGDGYVVTSEARGVMRMDEPWTFGERFDVDGDACWTWSCRAPTPASARARTASRSA